MKKSIILIGVIFSMFTLSAEPLVVDKLILKTMDLTSSVNQVLDNNGNACGLLKVVSGDKSMIFEGSVVGTPEYKNGEYWVYMSPGAYQIRIKSNSHDPLMLNFRDYNLQKVESKATYELTFRYREYDFIFMKDHEIIQGPPLKKYAISILTLPRGLTVNGQSSLDYLKRLSGLFARDGDGWGVKRNCTILADYESSDHTDPNDIYCYRLIIETTDSEEDALLGAAAGYGGFEDVVYMVK